MSETDTAASGTRMRFYAKTAGMLYLLIIFLGIGSEVFIRAALIVPGDAARTAAAVLAAQPQFRLGFFADSLMLLCDVAVAVLLYLFFRSVSRPLALAATAFRLTQTAVLGMNLLHYHAALLLLGSAPVSDAFDAGQRDALAALFLELHAYGYDLGLIFFALSNLILGSLLIRAQHAPSLLGYGLLGAAAVYLAGSYVRFLAPDYTAAVAPFYVVPLAAELAFALWLLIKGGAHAAGADR